MSKPKHKPKINPRRKPATQADVIHAKQQATNDAIDLVWSIFFTVLSDKEGYTLPDLQRVWEEVSDLSDSITKGYCTVKDLQTILHDEQGAELNGS